MKDSEANDLIQDYLMGQLSANDKMAFENRLTTDSVFAKQYNEEKILFDVVKDHGAIDFMSTVEDVMRHENIQLSPIPLYKRRIVQCIAASMLVLIAAVFLFQNKEESSTKLFTKYYEAYPMVLTQRNEASSIQQDIITAYGLKQWSTVSSLLEQSGTDVLPQPLADIYRAITKLELEDSQAAVAVLEKYNTQPADQLYQHLIEWYMALALLKDGRRTESKERLKTINGELPLNSPLRPQVKNLLSEL